MSEKSTVNLYLEPFNYNTDFLYKNSTALGYGSIPEIQFDSETDYRLQNDYIKVLTTDICVIKYIKTLEYKTSVAKNKYILSINSFSDETIELYGFFKDDTFSLLQTIDLLTGQFDYEIELDNYQNLSSLAFFLPSTFFQFDYTLSDIEIECWDGGVEINVEAINVSVDTKLKSHVTLDNSIYTTKLNGTQYAYTSELILTDEEFNQLNDFINIARMYERNVLLDINVSEVVGNRIAGTPDTENQNFTLAGIETTEKTGLYKYVTISYFSTPSNKVR